MGQVTLVSGEAAADEAVTDTGLSQAVVQDVQQIGRVSPASATEVEWATAPGMLDTQ